MFRFLSYLLVTIIAAVSSYFTFINVYYLGRILPNTYISGLNVGGLTKEEALVKTKLLIPTNKNIILSTDRKEYIYNSNYFKFDYDLIKTVEEAYSFGRSRDLVSNLEHKAKMFLNPIDIEFSYNFDNSLIDIEISRIVGEEKIAGKDANFYLKDGVLAVDPERDGLSVDYQVLKKIMEKELSRTEDSNIKIPFYQKSPDVTTSELLQIQDEVLKKFYKDLKLKFFEKNKVVPKNEVFSLLKVRKNKDGLYYDLSEEGVRRLSENAKQFVDNKPRAMVTKFEGDKVLDFMINKEGSVLDELKFRKDLRTALFEGQDVLSVAVLNIGENLPKEAYGIRDLLAVGKSKFVGSIPNRAYNIELSSSKITGTLVGPGEEFSFLRTVGPINGAEGFQSAYVISGGRTVLGEGGGVCQTSTTLFRAVLNSGLPITSRYPHAYRVGYYEQDMPVGFDASVYYPSLDFKFINDTGKHILIQSEYDPKKLELSFYIFGTKDGREVSISEPKLYGYIPTPAPLYIDDSSLAPGKVKQVDFPASGISSSFTRVVTKDGEKVIDEKFTSTYSPWRAIYLRGVDKKR